MLHTGARRPTARSPSATRAARAAASALPAEPVVLEAGRAEVRREGTDVALLAVGPHGRGGRAARPTLLAAEGVSASVVNMRWVKPLDLETVAWAAADAPARRHDRGEHRARRARRGRAGGALRPGARRRPCCTSAIPDCFVTHGATDQLLAEVGLTPEGVRDAVLGRLARTAHGKGARP